MRNWLAVPKITRGRLWFAFAVATATDTIQIMLGPAGWLMADELLDITAMVAISWAIGFHPLLLPTFLLELFPVVDMLPTWVGCTAAVILIRRRSTAPPVPPVVTSAAPPIVREAPRALKPPPEPGPEKP